MTFDELDRELTPLERKALGLLRSIGAASWLIALLVGAGILMIFILGMLGY